jgi:hypothetical protein
MKDVTKSTLYAYISKSYRSSFREAWVKEYNYEWFNYIYIYIYVYIYINIDKYSYRICFLIIGTARGGFVVSVVKDLGLPVKFIGLFSCFLFFLFVLLSFISSLLIFFLISAFFSGSYGG